MPPEREPKRPPRMTAPLPDSSQRSATYLDHGTDSLVALDNPDDSQLGAPPRAKETPSNE